MNRTIERAFKTLELISLSKDGLTLTEITDKLGIPKSSSFNIIQTLVNLGFAQESHYNQKRYILGSNTYSLGMKYLENLNFIDLCKIYLNPLADELHRNSFVGILDQDKVIYVHKHVGVGAKLATCEVGTRNDLFCTGLGKVLLAYSTPDKVNQIIDKIQYVRKTDRTIVTKEDLYRELQKTKERGYAVDDREVERFMLCFAAPIFNCTGDCIAAISISDLYSRDADYEYYGRRIKECAMKISEKLGYKA